MLLLTNLSAGGHGTWVGTREYRRPIDLNLENILAESAKVGVGVCRAHTNPHGAICLQRDS